MTPDDQAKPPLTGPLMPSDPARPLVDQWPLCSLLQLAATPRAVPYARRHARLTTGEWGLDDLGDAIELIVSELVTNAVLASIGQDQDADSETTRPGSSPPIQLSLFSDKRQVLIQVWDANDRQPTRRAAEPSAENGRGLLIVEDLSSAWGTCPAVGVSGKLVWARVG